MKRIHEFGLVHRDLKPNNILINREAADTLTIKIADFGLVDQISEQCPTLNIVCGTPGFIAPEILKEYHYDTKSDIFSIGSLLYFLLTGKTILYGKSFD